MKNKELVNRLKEALTNAPHGAKARIKDMHSRQKVRSILEDGREDESIIESVLADLKIASQKVFEETKEANEKVQQA